MQHSRYCLGGLRCPRVATTSVSQGRCAPARGDSRMPIPGVGGDDPSAGCGQERDRCIGHLGEPLVHCPTTQPGMGCWVQGSFGSPRLRQGCCCCVPAAQWHRGSGGLISRSLLNSSKCRNLFSLFNSPSRRTDSKKG